jgi:hypothetical protein
MTFTKPTKTICLVEKKEAAVVATIKLYIHLSFDDIH